MTGIVSIFRIQQGGEVQTPVETSGQTDPKTAELTQPKDKTPSEKEDVKDAVAKESEAQKQEPSGKPDLVIKVEGPVGRVFTEALNKVLAKEGMAGMMLQGVENSTDDSEDDDGRVGQNDQPAASPIEVHTVDAQLADLGDVVRINDAISQSTQNEHVIAIEHAHNQSKAIHMLDQLGSRKNVRICLSIDEAARYVGSKVTS